MNFDSANIIIVGVFLLLEAVVIIKNIKDKSYYDFFWFCDFAPIFLAIGFFIGNDQFVKGVINVGLITQFNTLVFLSKELIRDRKFPEIIIHLFPINLALLLTYKIATLQVSLVYSLLVLVFIFGLTLIFVPREKDVNFIDYVPLNFLNKPRKIKLPYHTILWVIYTEIIIVIPTYFIQLFLSRLG